MPSSTYYYEQLKSRNKPVTIPGVQGWENGYFYKTQGGKTRPFLSRQTSVVEKPSWLPFRTKKDTTVIGCLDQPPPCYAHACPQWLHIPKELPAEWTGELSDCQSADAVAVCSCILNPHHLLVVHHTLHSQSQEF